MKALKCDREASDNFSEKMKKWRCLWLLTGNEYGHEQLVKNRMLWKWEDPTTSDANFLSAFAAVVNNFHANFLHLGGGKKVTEFESIEWTSFQSLESWHILYNILCSTIFFTVLWVIEVICHKFLSQYFCYFNMTSGNKTS